MTVMRVERVVYGVADLAGCERFFGDFGLERCLCDHERAEQRLSTARAYSGSGTGPAPGSYGDADGQ